MKDVLKAVVVAGLFAVPFLTLYVENDYFFPFITGKNFWFRIIVDVTFAAWVILALYESKYRPRISGITWSFGILLIIMFFANLFGVHPQSSFWSNFERMDGYVSLVHTFLYMLVLGSVLQTKQMWDRLLKTSLTVAFLVALYGLAQFGGLVEGSSRIDSRLGNASYMAVYMLFHIFVAFWLFVETKNIPLKVTYALLVTMFGFVLLETGTRGTAIGLAVGVTVMAAYIGLFGQQFKQYRKYAIGALALIVVLAGALVMNRDSEFVQSRTGLMRIANISLNDIEIRSIIWGSAWEGVKERPLLGYGQSNFNYVFNANYDPRLYAQEQWFDRSHNIIMDWLTTGGFLGLIAYLSIFAWCGWYLFLRPLLNKDDESFNVLERGVLLGILAGYFTHNFVVFDNIVSYIFFAIILGLITYRVGSTPKSLADFKVDNVVVTQFAAPIVIVLLVASIWHFHRPGMIAAGEIINGFRAADPDERLDAMERAAAQNSFANQEIAEQISQQAISVVRNPSLSEATKQRYAAAAEEQLKNLIESKPGDARVHVFAGSYYRSIGDNFKAKEQMDLARQFSPKKQSIIIQQGFIALALGNTDDAAAYLKEAFLLDENNLEAREYYAVSLIYQNKIAEVRQLMETEDIKMSFANSDFLVSTANQFNQTDLVTELFEYRIYSEEGNARYHWNDDPQNWATLAFLYYQQDRNEEAVRVLSEAEVKLTSFAPTATCLIESIESGGDPQVDCQ
ncbi:O-antigen ligase family protein [Candidatus Kaiserbacteria bacterium]|nr:O-antigen ligase family protein [Candidatus Kaiserbacteria bacterium]